MAAKRSEKKLSKLIIKLSVVAASVYLVVSFVAGQMRVSAMKQELEIKNEMLQQQTVANQEMIAMMESGNEDVYIERIAREKLGYVRPNEQVFIDISGE